MYKCGSCIHYIPVSNRYGYCKIKVELMGDNAYEIDRLKMRLKAHGCKMLYKEKNDNK